MDPIHPLQSNETTYNSNVRCNYCFMKRTLLFLLLPISLLSLFLSFTTGFSFIYSLNYLSLVNLTFLQSLERKYMFLICNGILAFLAKTFSFTCSEDNPSIPAGPSENNIDVAQESGDDEKLRSEPPPPESKEAPPAQDKGVVSWDVGGEEIIEGQESEDKEETTSPYGEWKEEGKKGVLISESEEEESEEEEEESGLYDVEILTSGGGNEVINMNTEELNKKFEEFIRKMKEEIRIEAQHHLIAV